MRRAWVHAACLMSLLLLVSLATHAGAQSAQGQRLPEFGEYVYTEELPEKTEGVAPLYPQLAREAGVEGTVMVQALIDASGRVVDTRIVKSIPMLDAAAMDCVRKWRFKPARSNGQPIAVWVGCPVRFSLADKPASGIAPAPAPPAPTPDAPFERRERGARPLPWRETARLSTGEYFINDDPSAIVVVTELDDQRVRLESPGQWDGVGLVDGDTYWGVFVYRDDAPDPRNNGARGTHLGTISAAGRIRVEGAFTNRQWAPFALTLTRSDADTRSRPSRWPAAWFTGGTQLLLDEPGSVDTPPGCCGAWSHAFRWISTRA